MPEITDDQYRAVAKRLFPHLAMDAHAHVMPMSDGAFVEMIAWVPREAVTSGDEELDK